jgi:replication factor C subunit 1
VQLVCKELEFDIVEFNASDTRSKKLLHEEVSEMLSTQSLSGMFSGIDCENIFLVDSHLKLISGSGKAALSKKRVLLMEEVDGMAG